MSTRRTIRVAEVLRKELSACLTQCLDLEDLLITISSVELPPDLKQAYVYVSTLNPALEHNVALKLLNANRREWQGRIGRRLGLKFTPQLIFRFDSALQRGDRVMEILSQIGDEAPAADELLPGEELPLTPEEIANRAAFAKIDNDEDDEEEPAVPIRKVRGKKLG